MRRRRLTGWVASHELRGGDKLDGRPRLVLPDRFVRIRYYGLLANRHREKALALCREVLPGPPAPPKLTRSDWQSLLQSLTGVDPMRCEVCGQNALHWIGELKPAPSPRAPPR